MRDQDYRVLAVKGLNYPEPRNCTEDDDAVCYTLMDDARCSVLKWSRAMSEGEEELDKMILTATYRADADREWDKMMTTP